MRAHGYLGDDGKPIWISDCDCNGHECALAPGSTLVLDAKGTGVPWLVRALLLPAGYVRQPASLSGEDFPAPPLLRSDLGTGHNCTFSSVGSYSG
jgi:hypothetical protein